MGTFTVLIVGALQVGLLACFSPVGREEGRTEYTCICVSEPPNPLKGVGSSDDLLKFL